MACGGDITLAFTYKPSFDDDEETSVKTKVLTSEKIDKVYNESMTDQRRPNFARHFGEILYYCLFSGIITF